MDTREQSIRRFIDPASGRAIFAEARIDEQDALTRITVGYPCREERSRLERQLGEWLDGQGFPAHVLEITSEITPHRVQAGLKPLAEVKQTDIVSLTTG